MCFKISFTKTVQKGIKTPDGKWHQWISPQMWTAVFMYIFISFWKWWWKECYSFNPLTSTSLHYSALTRSSTNLPSFQLFHICAEPLSCLFWWVSRSAKLLATCPRWRDLEWNTWIEFQIPLLPAARSWTASLQVSRINLLQKLTFPAQLYSKIHSQIQNASKKPKHRTRPRMKLQISRALCTWKRKKYTDFV